MGPVGRTRVSLRFGGDDLDPDTLTTRLDCLPTRARRAGETLPSGHVVRRGSWHLQSELLVPGNLDAQIINLLALPTSDLAIWNELSRRYRGNLFCGLFLTEGNQGLDFEPETLTAIGARGLVLDLDIYGAEMPD